MKITEKEHSKYHAVNKSKGKNELLPREKLKHLGLESLELAELVALILQSGSVKRSVFDMAKDLAKVLERYAFEDIRKARLQTLSKSFELSESKAAQICAAIELGQRMAQKKSRIIEGPSDVFYLIQNYGKERTEHFLCLSLDGSNCCKNIHLISKGTANSSLVHPREVFYPAILEGACSVILAHNHPSGNLEPSNEDLAITKRLIDAGELLGIPVLDHIIISKTGYKSIQNLFNRN